MNVLDRRVHRARIGNRQVPQGSTWTGDVGMVDVVADEDVVPIVQDVLNAEQIGVFSLRC